MTKIASSSSSVTPGSPTPWGNTGLKCPGRKSGGVGPADQPVATVAAAGVSSKSESVATVAGFGSGPPPQVSARPDWLQGTWAGVGLEKFYEALEVLERSTGEKFQVKLDCPVTRGVKWDGIAISPNCCQLAYRKLNEVNYQFWVSIPGTIWGTTPKIGWEKLCCYLHYQRDWNPTRLDLALDDYGKKLDLETVVSAVKSGKFAGARKFQLVESGERGKEQRGVAVVLGSASSDKRVTIYDKEVESQGKIKSIRIEVRLRDDLAKQAWNKLFWKFWEPSLVADYVLGALSFLERKDRHLSRAKILDWWGKFLSYVKASPKKLKRLPKLRTVEKSLDWLRRQVAPTLTTLSRAAGPMLLHRLLEVGEKNFRRNPWLKTLESQFKVELKELQDWIISRGVAYDTCIDAI